MAEFRRTWDRKKFEAKALKRLQDEKKNLKTDIKEVTKEVLKKDLILRSQKAVIGKTFLKAQTKKIFYCDICDVQCNDSIGHMSHLNSKDHHKKLGINIKHNKKSSLEQIQERFKLAKRRTNLNNLEAEYLKKQRFENEPLEKVKEDSETISMQKIMGFKSFGKVCRKKNERKQL